MAGKTKIGITDVAGSHLMSQGWKLITDYVNKNSNFGILTKDGDPFYKSLVDYDNNISFLNDEIRLGDSNLNPFADKMNLGGDSTGAGKNLVEVGIQSYNYTHGVNITNAPVEGSNFISINQVRNPIQGQVTYLSTGTEKQRSYFERALNYSIYELITFNLFARSVQIENIKITSYTISQSAENSGQLLKYLVNFQEVQRTVMIFDPLENARPFSGSTTNIGNLQTQDVNGVQGQRARRLP